MVNLIIKHSIHFLFFMNVVGSTFLFLSIGAMYLFRKELAPRHKLLFYKVNILLFLLPVPLLTNHYKKVFYPFMTHPKPTDKVPLHFSVQIVQNKLIFHSENISVGFLIGFLFCISVILSKGIWNLQLYLKVKTSCSTLNSNPVSKSFTQAYTVTISTLSKDLKLHRPPQVSFSDKVSVPFVTGFWNTKLFLPSFFDLTDDTNYLIIKHELAHLKSHDNLFKLLLIILSVLFWYNPFIYLLIYFYQNTSELAADDFALMNCTFEQKKNYGNAILNYASTSSYLPLVSLSRFTFHQKNVLAERITHMKKHTTNKYFKLTLIATILGIVLLSFASSLPILAYSTPVVATDNITSLDELNDEDEAILADGYFSVIDEDEDTFLFSDSYFTDEEGNNYELPVSESASERKSCNHSYVKGTYTTHKKNSNGGCTVKKYNIKKCSSCNDVILGSLIFSQIYTKCPH